MNSASGHIGVLEIRERGAAGSRQVHLAAGQTLYLGRALDNDVVVADPYVCARHLELTPGADGLTVQDLDSVNGMYIGNTKKRVDATLLLPGQELQIGHSSLRFHADSLEPAPTLLDVRRHGWLRYFSRAGLVPLWVLVTLVALTVDKILNLPTNFTWGDILDSLFYPAFALLCWSGLWALVSRLLIHRANFFIHLSIACVALTLWLTSNQLIELLSFGLGWDSATGWFKYAAQIALFGLALYAHLRYATASHHHLQKVVPFVLVAALFGIDPLIDWGRQHDFSDSPRLAPLIKPPAFQIQSGVSISAYQKETENLRQILGKDKEKRLAQRKN